MAFIPSAVFNLLEGDPNYRKIEAQIESDPVPGLGTVYNVYYEVIGPVATLKVADFLTPDGVLDNANPIATMPLVNLPVDSAGATLEGTYTLNYYMENVITPGVYEEVSCTITLDVLKEGAESCRIQGNIGFEVDCVCYQIKVTDNTLYGDTTLESRELTIIPPTIPGQAQPAPISTTEQTITFGFDYSNVTYLVNLESVYSHVSEDGCITVRENLLSQLSQKVVCDFNLCKLIQCIEETLLKLEKEAALKGGWPNLDTYKKDILIQLQENLTLMNLYRTCGNYTKVYDIYNRIVALLGCDCGCTEQNTEHPVPVSPACGGAGGNITDITGISPIVVNQSGTTAVISLDPAFLASLGGLQDVVIGAGSTAYLTAVTATNISTIDFDPSPLAWSPYVQFSNASVASISGYVDYTGLPQPVRYSINAFFKEIKIDGWFKIQGFSPICLNPDELIDLTNYPNVVVGMPIPAHDSNGEYAGMVYLANSTVANRYQLIFAASSSLSNRKIVINGRINLD